MSLQLFQENFSFGKWKKPQNVLFFLLLFCVAFYLFIVCLFACFFFVNLVKSSGRTVKETYIY